MAVRLSSCGLVLAGACAAGVAGERPVPTSRTADEIDKALQAGVCGLVERTGCAVQSRPLPVFLALLSQDQGRVVLNPQPPARRTVACGTKRYPVALVSEADLKRRRRDAGDLDGPLLLVSVAGGGRRVRASWTSYRPGDGYSVILCGSVDLLCSLQDPTWICRPYVEPSAGAANPPGL